MIKKERKWRESKRELRREYIFLIMSEELIREVYIQVPVNYYR